MNRAVDAAGRIVYSQNFVSGQNDALDHYGHGTHVAGLIAGNGAQSRVACISAHLSARRPTPTSSICAFSIKTAPAPIPAVIAAIDEAISLKNTYNIRVINLSLGRPIYESYTLDPLCQAVEKAWKAGIVVVVAAGNDGRNLNLNPEGYGTIDSPGNDPYALTVGAMSTMETPAINDDMIASYSSKGPSFIDHVIKPDIVAPGNLVTSLQFSGDPLAIDNPSFYTLYSFYETNGSETPSQQLLPAQRHQHGYRRHQRRGCGPAAGGASTDSRRSEGAADGERRSQLLSGNQQRDRQTASSTRRTTTSSPSAPAISTSSRRSTLLW